jgi:hypothetical protein
VRPHTRRARLARTAEALVAELPRASASRLLAAAGPEFREAVETTFRRLPRLAGQFGIS